MGKNDFLSPKDIANRIKSKGLQKLRWYCQMCGKQCRDENGFKCHLTSDSHKRQMEVFGQNPHRVIEGFSEEFEKSFLDHLRRSHPFSRVSANVVYNEFIQDRQHVHMNSTHWVSLTEFVKHLGKSGTCKVDDTPKGWYISLVSRDPADELEEKRRNKRERADKEDADRQQRALEAQIERARQAAAQGGADEPAQPAAELNPEDLDKPLGFSLAARQVGGEQRLHDSQHVASNPAFDDGDEAAMPGRPNGAAAGPPAKRSKLEEMMKRDLQAKHRLAASSSAAPEAARPGEGRQNTPWLAQGVIVKVMSKALREHGYYKQKGEVLRVIDGLLGEIEMLGSGDVVRVDQAELETVIPQPGGAVLVVGGPLRGSSGTLVGIDERRFQAEVQVTDRRSGAKVRQWVEYEDLSKLAARGEGAGKGERAA